MAEGADMPSGGWGGWGAVLDGVCGAAEGSGGGVNHGTLGVLNTERIEGGVK